MNRRLQLIIFGGLATITGFVACGGDDGGGGGSLGGSTTGVGGATTFGTTAASNLTSGASTSGGTTSPTTSTTASATTTGSSTTGAGGATSTGAATDGGGTAGTGTDGAGTDGSGTGGNGTGGDGSGGTGGDGSGGSGEGGQAGAGTGCDEPDGLAVYTFDEPGSIGDFSIRAEDANEGGLGDSFLMRSATEGHSCPGSLVLTVPFSVYGPAEIAEAQGNFSADWTGYTTLHVWVKLEEPAGGSLDYLNGVQLFVLSDGYAEYDNTFVSASTFDDFDWHEITVDMATEGTVLGDINQVGVQLLAHESQENAGGDGAPDAPETTSAYIDDIYVD